MRKQRTVWTAILLAAVVTLAACGGADSPAATPDAAAAGSEAAPPMQGEAVSSGSDTSGAGDASGANSAGDAASAVDVGSGSDGAQSSGGSNGAGGTTAPESDSGAPVDGGATGSAQSGAGSTQDESVPYTAISDAECTEIQGQLGAALGADVNRTTGVAAFSDLSGGTGESCQLTITGTGVQFPSLADAATSIGQLFTDNGWTADPQYAADGPTATIGGLRRDRQLAAYTIEWSPVDSTACPQDQPISACAETLTPEQMVYNITVDLAQR